MSELTGAQKASLIDALLSGYTSDEQLAALLDLRLDVKLAEIAQDGTLREQAFAVVTWAEANGRTKELALKAQAWRHRNAKLTNLVDALYPGERLPPADAWGDGDAGRESEVGAGGASRSQSRGASNRRGLILGAVAIAAILIVVIAIAIRVRDDGRGGAGTGSGVGGHTGNSGRGSSGGSAGKDRPSAPLTMRFTTLSAIATATPPRVVVDARFPPPQLAPGAVLWFSVGSGPRCGNRVDRAVVDNPSLGYMTFVLGVERERITCGQLFVEDANGQTIGRSDPQTITFQSQ